MQNTNYFIFLFVIIFVLPSISGGILIYTIFKDDYRKRGVRQSMIFLTLHYAKQAGINITHINCSNPLKDIENYEKLLKKFKNSGLSALNKDLLKLVESSKSSDLNKVLVLMIILRKKAWVEFEYKEYAELFHYRTLLKSNLPVSEEKKEDPNIPLSELVPLLDAEDIYLKLTKYLEEL